MEELEAERERAKKQSTKSVYSILFVFLAESAVFPTESESIAPIARKHRAMPGYPIKL